MNKEKESNITLIIFTADNGFLSTLKWLLLLCESLGVWLDVLLAPGLRRLGFWEKQDAAAECRM